jgi:hypothetical protein
LYLENEKCPMVQANKRISAIESTDDASANARFID